MCFCKCEGIAAPVGTLLTGVSKKTFIKTVIGSTLSSPHYQKMLLQELHVLYRKHFLCNPHHPMF